MADFTINTDDQKDSYIEYYNTLIKRGVSPQEASNLATAVYPLGSLAVWTPTEDQDKSELLDSSAPPTTGINSLDTVYDPYSDQRIDPAIRYPNNTDSTNDKDDGNDGNDTDDTNDNTNLNTREDITSFLESLLSQNESQSIAPDLTEQALISKQSLNDIEILALKIKPANPELALSIMNMSQLPKKQVFDILSFWYDLALAQSQIQGERRNYNGMGIQKPKNFRKKAKNYKKANRNFRIQKWNTNRY